MGLVDQDTLSQQPVILNLLGGILDGITNTVHTSKDLAVCLVNRDALDERHVLDKGIRQGHDSRGDLIVTRSSPELLLERLALSRLRQGERLPLDGTEFLSQLRGDQTAFSRALGVLKETLGVPVRLPLERLHEGLNHRVPADTQQGTFHDVLGTALKPCVIFLR